MKDYSAYLFDWDGTLAQSHQLWLELLRQQLEPRGIHLTDEQLVRQIFGRYEEGMEELGFSSNEIETLGTALDSAASQQFALIELYPNARDVLTTLKQQGKKIGLVTTTYRDIMQITISRHELMDLFDVIVTGDEMSAQKPDPSGVLVALHYIGIRPDRAIMIGDSPRDLMAGNNAGSDTLLFYSPGHETQHSLAELTSCKPTYSIRSWQEMLNQLQ